LIAGGAYSGPLEQYRLRRVRGEDGILEVEFSSGAQYEYYRVPRRVFDGLLSSSSPGQYLATNVKDVYQYRRLR